MFGTVRQLADGRVELRFERWFPHSCDKVWRALTTAAELRAWFVEILDYDRSRLTFTPGATLEFVADGFPPGRGEVLVCTPPSVLEYTWDAEVLRFELAGKDGGCLLVFTNTVADGGTAAAVDPGWDLGLKRLADALDL
jgi:uncharacterized protein YndB with AHSA1/START domain